MKITFKRSFHFWRSVHYCICCRESILLQRSISYSHPLNDCKNSLDKEVPKVKPFNEDKDRIWVGPPHPVSNLRLKVFPSSKVLTKEEEKFYERSLEIQEWNQEYWESHNIDFEKSKKSYIEKKTKEKNLDSNTSLNTEEMADFYKDFLNKTYKKHLTYNWQWYKRNFELIYLSAKAQLSRLRRLVKYRPPFHSMDEWDPYDEIGKTSLPPEVNLQDIFGSIDESSCEFEIK